VSTNHAGDGCLTNAVARINLATMIDGKQRAAGEREEDHPTREELMLYWFGRYRDTLLANGAKYPKERV
jgi:hypothetical protein